MSEGQAPGAEPVEGNAHSWNQEETWGDDGTYSYGYDTTAGNSRQDNSYGAQPLGHAEADGDGVWEQQIAGAEFTPEEWQWVQGSGGEGYYYNSVTGEARWDDPAAFQTANNHALVERGYEQVLEGRHGGVSSGTGADQSVLAEYYGEDSYTFTAEDGTVWSYDEELGDYVRQLDAQPRDGVEGEVFRLDPAAGSSWQRIDSEGGLYYYNPLTQESSWDPPPEWQETPTAWGADYQPDDGAGGLAEGGPRGISSGGNGEGYGSEENDHYGENNHEPRQDGEYASSISAANSASYGQSGTGEPDRSGYGTLMGADTASGGRLADGMAARGPGSQPSTKIHVQDGGGAVSEGGERQSGGGSGDDSSGGSSLDRTSADELSLWSLEKLREVSKTLPGKWFVSDFLVDRATADYDMMLSMSASEIEAFKNKPGIAEDGSLYFVHQDTGEARWSFPVRAWEVKTKQLALLTPRAPTEVGSGVCRLRETDEMRKKRLAHRWKVEEMLAKEAARRLENPTPAEAAEAALEAIVTAIEREEERKRRRIEHNARALERSRWHPAALGFLMQRLEVPPSTTALAMTSAKGAEDGPETKMILTDADFVDMKLTQGGSAIPWGPETVPESLHTTPRGRPSTVRRTRRGIAAALHSQLPAKLLQLPRAWGSLLGPSGSTAGRGPGLPSLRKLGSVRSIGDLKRELAAAGATVRSATAGLAKGAPQLAAAGLGDLALKKSDGGDERKQPEGKRRTTPQAGAAPAAASAARDRVAPAGAAVGAAAEGEASPPAKIPTAAADTKGSLETGRRRDAAAAAAASAGGSSAGGDGRDIVEGTAAGEDAGVDGASRVSNASAGDRGGSSLSRNKGSVGGRAANDGESSASGGHSSSSGSSSRSRSGVNLSSAPMAAGSPVGLKADAGRSTTAPDVRQHAKRKALEASEKRGHQHPRGEGSTSPLVLPAVESINEQVRGLGARLALKIEGGELDPSRAAGAVAEIAKSTLVSAGKAVGFPTKPAAVVVEDRSARPISPQPPPPDTSTVTIELACRPPPRNLLTTVRVKDPATGKTYAREKLTSVLRDAWEGMIIRDIATAGGVDPKQVLIEEVRRHRPLGRTTTVPSDAAPFRPDRHDEARRDRTRRHLAAPPPTAERVAPPSHASNSRLGASLGAEAAGSTLSPFAVGLQKEQPQQQTESRAVIGGWRRAEDGDDLDPMALAGALPPAGLRATLARRLAAPVAKKRRLGDSSRGAGRGGGCDGDGDGDDDDDGVGKKGGGDDHGHDDANSADAATIARSNGEEGASDSPPGADTAPHTGSLHLGMSASSVAGVGGADPIKAKASSGGGTWLPRIASSNTRGHHHLEEEPGDWMVRRRGAIVGGGGPWVGMNFADINDDDENAVGIGAGNHRDVGTLGRTEQRPAGRSFERLREKKQETFDPHDEGRVKDPEVQAAIEELARDDPCIKSWQAKDGVMKAMSRRERIPTLRELKLAGRVERARALFGPGGYLYASASEDRRAAEKDGPAAATPTRPELPEEARATGRAETGATKHRATDVEGSQQVEEESGQEHSSQKSSAEQDRVAAKTCSQGSPRSDPKGAALDGAGRGRAAGKVGQPRAPAGAVTTVTVTIVGGRPRGRGITGLAQSEQTPSEAVAKRIALQAGVECSDLLMGGLTHTGYWCQSISPVFFGRSVRSRRITKAEAGRRRQEEAEATRAAGEAAGPGESTGPDAANTVAGGSSDGPGVDAPTVDASAASPASVNRRFLTLNEQLELAETRFQDLMAEGLPDGVRMKTTQYKAMLARDRTIKMLLLRRKIRAKRESGGLTRARCPFRQISAEEARGWKKEIEDEERNHRAVKLLEDARRREARLAEARKRGERQLKAWIIRHLVASNEGDSDLMAKAIAADGHDGESLMSGGPAGKGAPGRESSMSGRNARPGGRFAYGQETSEEDIRKKDLMIKAQRRFERDTETLLRESFRGASRTLRHQQQHQQLLTPGDAAHAPSNPVDGIAQRRSSGSSSSPPSRDPVKSATPGSAEPPRRETQAASGSGVGGGSVGEDADRPTPPSSGGDPTIAAVGEGLAPRSSVSDHPAEKAPKGNGDIPKRNENIPKRIEHLNLPKRNGVGSVPDDAERDPKREQPGPEGEDRRGAGDGDVRDEEGVQEEPENGEAAGRASQCRGHERDRAEPVPSIPRAGLLRLLRKPGGLRRKFMASDAVRPVLTDRVFTKAFLSHPATASEGAVTPTDITEDGLVLFGSVIAEVDRWVRATLDPVRAKAEERVKSFEARKKRARDNKGARLKGNPGGVPPSEAWRGELKVARTTNRGDGREWSRFHHHVLVRTSDDLPLYCCLCRRRKWDEARLVRLKAEHAARSSWDADLSERQEILEPMVEAVIQGALVADRALRENDQGAWAALLCLEGLVAAVPGRVESLAVAGDAVEYILDRAMRESFSVEEWTRRRRMAALAKLRALEAFHDSGEQASRRRSRRVSVGPSGIPVPTRADGEAGSPGSGAQEDREGVSNGVESTGPPSRYGGVAMAAMATVAAGRMGAGVVRGRRRGFAEFSDQARVVAEKYYRGPRDRLAAAARAAPSWGGLREIWFKVEEHEGDGLDEEKAVALQARACGVEVLDGERQTWERQERERRGMFAQDESQRRDDETLRRAAEAAPREIQEAGHRAFCLLIDTMERPCQSLARLRWELTADLGDMQSTTTRVRDAATGKRYVCRLLACRGREEVDFLLQEAYRIQEIRNRHLVKTHSAHPHCLATYDARGVQTTGGRGVLIQAEFCSGGTLQDYLKLLLDAWNRGACKRAASSRSDRRYDGCDREVIGPKSRKVYTPEVELMAKAEEEQQKQRSARMAATAPPGDAAATGKHGGDVPLPETLRQVAVLPDGNLARRMEIWMRQGFSDNSAGLRALHEGFGCAATAPPEYELHGETSAKIKAALFMCLQRDPGVRVSSLNLWKFMAASGDSSSNKSSGRAPIPAKKLSAHEGSALRSAALLAGRPALRPRVTRVGSTVEVGRRNGVVETAWTGAETLPDTALLDTAAAVAATAAEALTDKRSPVAPSETPAVAAAAAAAPPTATATRAPRRKKRGKEPEVMVEGDLLVNTPKMVALVWSALALNAAYLVQALATVTAPTQALWTAAGAFVGYLIADLVSGVFHWSVDNYGDGDTPVFGAVIEAFQGHHASPWTITHRPFENNVHKIAYAVLPLLLLLRIVNPGPAGVTLGVTFLVGSLMSNEFHRYAHMTEPPPLVRGLQEMGVSVSRREHGRHHSSPFEEKYCIVTGICNGPLDHFRVFRFLERVVYRLNGVEPIAWKLDPSVKEIALSTGWLPFSDATAAAAGGATVEDAQA
eukprot:g1941.t1